MTEDAPALFGVAEVRPRRPGTVGTVERALQAALAAGFEKGTHHRDVDGPLAESAMVLARALDTADAVGGLKGGYLAAQTQPALQKALHALRLPTEIAAGALPVPPANGQGTAQDWFSDTFGRPE